MQKPLLLACLMMTSMLLSKEKVIVEKVQGVVLVSEEQKLKNVHGVHVQGLKIPGTLAALTERLEPLFLNKPLTSSLLLDLKKQIVQYYSDHHRPLALVRIPEQDVTKGVVQLVVVESRLGQLVCKGNRHFNDSTLKKYIRIKPGQEIRSDHLLSDVAFICK